MVRILETYTTPSHCVIPREHLKMTIFDPLRYRVRPYLAENTISRPICEVKQPQALLVLRSVMTWEPSVPYSLFSNFFLVEDENLIPSKSAWKCLKSTGFRHFGPKVAGKKISKISQN